ncbi:30S ribosomal protein S16 [Candidatus Peregrinibacteria bacterium]|nr:30S ribosomal protein S16 [Candidatus Peregrinibacteria bacterium]
MLVIRLRRTGRKKQATYNVVVAEKANAVKGKFIENLGSYNPTVNPKELTYDLDRIKHWVSNGAQPSDTVASLLKRDGVDGMEKFIDGRGKKRKKKKEVPEKEVKEAAPVKEEAAPVETPEAPVKTVEAPATPEAPAAEETAPAEEAKEEVAKEPKEEEKPEEETPAEEPKEEKA